MHVQLTFPHREAMGASILLDGHPIEEGVRAMRFEAEANKLTRITFEMSPRRVALDGDPVVYFAVGNRRFRVVEDVSGGDLDEGFFGEVRRSDGRDARCL